MRNSVRAGVAALAFIGLVAQPIVADACTIRTPAAGGDPSFGIAWALGFMLCAGMTVGQQDEWAKAHHQKTVSGSVRAHGFLACVFPGYGFYKLTHKA